MNRNPVDGLIEELIRTGRAATPAEVRSIAERMAAVPFDPRMIPMPTRLRGLTYQGRVLGARSDSMTYHLVKRVLDERQWAPGTTAAHYLADLRRAIRHPAARLGLYQRRGGLIAVTLTPTAVAVPPSRLAPDSLPAVLVVYSADRGIIVTGYQVSGIEQSGIPEGARWLT